MLLIRLVFIAAFCYQNVFSKKVLCDFTDANCMTQGVARVYQEFIDGKVEGVPSSGTMFADLIEVDLPTIKYTMYNTTFSGLKNCAPEHVLINITMKTYQFHLACKHIVLKGIYDLKGKIGPMDVEGQGDYRSDHYDYVFLLSGGCEGYTDEDNKLHIKLYKDFEMDIEARGKVVYDFKNLYNGDKEKSDAMHKFANENWKYVDEMVREPFMKKFMGIYLEHANTYLTVLPVDHYYYQEINETE